MTKFNSFHVCVLFILFLCSVSVKAQKRVVDMIPIIESPAVGDTLYNGEESLLRVNVKNLGPDDLVAGDTLFMNVVSAGRIVQLIIETDIPSGATGVVMESNTFSMQISPQSPGVRGDFCMQLMDPEKNSITRNGIPVITTYEDPDISNNVSCNMILVLNRKEETSIRNLNNEHRFVIYPNPASTEIHIKMEEWSNDSYTLSIIDMYGRMVFKDIIQGKQVKSNGIFKLPVDFLNTGNYILELRNKKDINRTHFNILR